MQVRQNQFGNVSVTWSEPMSPEEFSELEEFIAIWMRGVKRRIVPAKQVEE